MTTTTLRDQPSCAHPWEHLARQFRTRYPAGVFDVTIELADLDRDLIILKATVMTGDLPNSGKGCGIVAGSLDQIEQLVYAAKQQALADLAITSTGILPETPDASANSLLASLSALDTQATTLKPARTAETLKAFYWKAYQIPVPQQEARWLTFASHTLGHPITDEQLLSEDELEQLHTAIQQQWQLRHARLSALATK